MRNINRVLLCLMALSFCIYLGACDKSESPQIVEIEVNNPNASYRIEKIDDEYFLSLDDLKNNGDYGVSGGIQFPAEMKSNSVEEMRDKILNGTLTKEEERTLVKFRSDENGRIRMFDPYELYKPKTPTEVDVHYVYWSGGAGYYVSLKPDCCSSGQLDIRTKGSFNSELNEKYYNVDAAENILVKKEKTKKEGIEATVYYYYDDNVKANNEYKLKGKILLYEIETQQGNLKVLEEYSYYNILDDELNIRVYLYGETDNCSYRYYLSNFVQDPSVEWLSSFGIEPLEVE